MPIYLPPRPNPREPHAKQSPTPGDRVHLVVIGDSLVTLWPINAVNLGVGEDRAENTLWRILHGDLKHFEAENIVLLVGTNNYRRNSPWRTAATIELIYQAIRFFQPSATISVVQVLRRREIASRPWVWLTNFLAAGRVPMVRAEIDPVIHTVDGLHLNSKGYRVLDEALSRMIRFPTLQTQETQQ
jgi:hypothetical protein